MTTLIKTVGTLGNGYHTDNGEPQFWTVVGKASETLGGRGVWRKRMVQESGWYDEARNPWEVPGDFAWEKRYMKAIIGDDSALEVVNTLTGVRALVWKGKVIAPMYNFCINGYSIEERGEWKRLPDAVVVA